MSRYLKLLAELERLDARIERARQNELPAVIELIRENLRLYRLTWSEILQATPKTTKPRGRSAKVRPGQASPMLAYARHIAAGSVLSRESAKPVHDGEYHVSNSALTGAKPPLPLPPKSKGQAPQKRATRKIAASSKAAPTTPRGTQGAVATRGRTKPDAKAPLPLPPKAKGSSPQKSASRKIASSAKAGAAPRQHGQKGAAATGGRAKPNEKPSAKVAPRKRK